MNESDLLLVVGASFSNHTGIAPYKPIVQIDDDPDRDRPVPRRSTVGVLGDAAVALAALDRRARRATAAERPARRRRRAVGDLAGREGPPGRRRPRPRRRRRPRCSPRCPRTCPTTPSIAVDVGNHAYSFGRYFESKGQPVLMSGYLGSIGFGYPAAMGAWAADPTRPVVAVTGDGGFGQYLAELTTAVKYGMPIKHVLLDNGALGKISKEQLAGELPGLADLAATTPTSPRTPELCGADRHPGRRAATELDAAMTELFAADGPALLHVHADGELV